jgi:hypothetical protein
VFRAVVRAEQHRAEQLAITFQHNYFKQKSAWIARDIKEIETFFLNQLDDREPAAETRWLDEAERTLSGHVGAVRNLEATVDRYGRSVQAI